MTANSSQAIELFLCYAREDEELRQSLEKQLRALRRQGLIDVWYDRQIQAGAEWEEEINKHLNTAQIILLLISPDFMDSDYCYGIEMKRAMERHQLGEAHVIPIILRPTLWQGALFGKLQALPTDAIPVVSRKWHHQDEAFFNIAEGVKKVVEDFFPFAQEKHSQSQQNTPDESIDSASFHQLLTVSAPSPQLSYANPLSTKKTPSRQRTPLLQYLSRRKVIVGGSLLAATALAGGGVWELLNVLNSPHLPYIYTGHTQGVNLVKWSPDPNSLNVASAGLDTTVQVWKALTGERITTYQAHTKAVTGVAWSPDGERIVSSDDQSIQIWNATNGNHLHTFTKGAPHDIAWSPNGKYIARTGNDSTVEIFDATSGQSLYTYSGHKAGVVSVAWSPNNRYIASGSLDSQMHVWEALNGVTLFPPLNFPRIIETVAWSPNGKYLAMGGDNWRVEVVDITGNIVYVYTGHTYVVRYVAWSPDGTRLASASFDYNVHVWDAFSGEHSFIYRGHRYWVTSANWSLDGKYIASSSWDKTVQIWNAPSS